MGVLVSPGIGKTFVLGRTEISTTNGDIGLIPAGHVAVQCTYFEKSASRNWLVPIHQDLSIPVARRVDAPGLRGWSQKEGALFVQAPVELLAQLVAVRVHLDACGADDGPLRVLPGSHRLGLVAPEAAVLARNAVAGFCILSLARRC